MKKILGIILVLPFPIVIGWSIIDVIGWRGLGILGIVFLIGVSAIVGIILIGSE